MMRPLSTPSAPGETDAPEPVYLRFRFNSETVEQFADRYAVDVSRGGIFIRSRRPPPVGTHLKLDLQLQNGVPIIVGEGIVFWTREPDPNKLGSVPGMGVRFSRLTSTSQQLIEQVLSDRSNRDRSGLFDGLGDATLVTAFPDGGSGGGSRPQTPLDVFSGRPTDGGPGGNATPELLANAGREETTPLVGVRAATIADSRPATIDISAGTGSAGEARSAQASESQILLRPPPALTLIEPAAIIGDDVPVRARASVGSMQKVPGLPIAKKRETSGSGSTEKAPEATQLVRASAPQSASAPTRAVARSPLPVAPSAAVPAAPIQQELEAPSGIPSRAPTQEVSGPTQAIRLPRQTPLPTEAPVSLKRPLITRKRAAGAISMLAVAVLAVLVAPRRAAEPHEATVLATPAVTVLVATAPTPALEQRAAPAAAPVAEELAPAVPAPEDDPAPSAPAQPRAAASKTVASPRPRETPVPGAP
jgi:uncharacterized protein (TIGR02266 family)